MADDLVPLTLVPVEVFGGEPDDDTWGYGLMDAVPAWSDCNRADGRIYRVDDTDPQYRKPDHWCVDPRRQIADLRKRPRSR